MTAFGFGEWGLGLRLVGGDKCVASWRSSLDRKSTRLNSSHGYISYAVFCLKKKKSHGTSFFAFPFQPPLSSLTLCCVWTLQAQPFLCITSCADLTSLVATCPHLVAR